MKARRRQDSLAAPVAYYQHFASGAQGTYRTAALFRIEDAWWVVAVDGEFRGDYEISEHGRLEDAREAIIAWAGKAREVDRDAIPPSIHRKFDYWRRNGHLDGDVN